jgi:hypothetical protein
VIAVTGSGTWPGTDVLEAQTVVVGDLTSVPDGIEGLPFTVRPAGRGPWADPVGTAAALLVDLPAELGVHGWMLSDRPGQDLGQAQALAREDLDALAVAAYGYVGRLVVPVLGPLTLAAQLYLARGDRVLADPGALREVSESLGAGIGMHVARVRGAVPGATVVVMLREQLLAQVMGGLIPSFSGRASLRSVPPPVAAERLRSAAHVVQASGGGQVVVDVGPSWGAIGTAVSAGVDAVGVTVARVDSRGWERVAETVEQGVVLWAALPGVVTSRSGGPDVDGQARAVLDPWRSVGLPLKALSDLVVLPEVPTVSGAESGWGTPAEARQALTDVVRSALILAERAES